jgi:cytoskeletal protein RodZ
MNNAQKIGAQLKEWRLAKGITLETIAAETRINISALRKIEEGRFKELPSFTYTRGFIKNYLRLVSKELTPELTDEIKKAYEELSLNTAAKFPVLDKDDSNLKELEDLSIHAIRKLLNLKTAIFISLIALIGLTVYFFKHINLHNISLYSSYFDVDTAKESTSEIKNIEDVLDISANKANLELTPTPLATATTEVAATKGTVTPTPNQVIEKPSENFPFIGFRKIKDLGIKNIEDSEFTKNEQIFPQNFRDLKPTYNDEQIVFVHAFTGDAWISYKSDEGTVKSYTLKLGEKIIIRGKRIFLSTGNIGALKIFYNSKYVVAEQPSSVKSFIFPPSAASEYSIPLFAANKLGEVYFFQDYLKQMMPKPANTPVVEPTTAP